MAEHSLPRDTVSEQMRPDQTGQSEGERKKPSRFRKLIRTLGAVALCAGLGMGTTLTAAAAVDIASARVVWQSNETTINLVQGAEKIAPGGEEWIVFGGLGQVNSMSAAKEFFNANKAAGKYEAVASVTYKNQGLDNTDHEILKDYIKERQIKRLGIVGVSMGLPTAMEWLYEIVEDAERDGVEIEWKLEDVVGYSSPFDDLDPWKSEALQWGAATHYPGGLYSKSIYNTDFGVMFDGASTTSDRLAEAERAMNKTFNNCSPFLFMSQVRLLDRVDLEKWAELSEHFDENATFVYLIGELRDDTVDAEQAARKYFEVFGVIVGDQWRMLRVVGAGHADTIRSALTFGLWQKEEAQAEQLTRERSWEEPGRPA